MRRRGHEDIASKDVYLNGFALVAVVAYLLLMLINPPSQKSDQPPPGNLIVTIVWPEGPTDIDVWVWSEGEERPIGYSNRTGKFWSLLRDDLGTRNDTLPANIENAYSREIPSGRTVVNTHCFSCPSTPVTVAIEVAVVNGGRSRILLRTNVTLHSNGQELTVVSFELRDGAMVPGSAHNVFFPMYENWGQPND